MNLFHITPTTHVASIQKRGLIPCFREGLTCGIERPFAVWLTDDPEYILRHQLGIDQPHAIFGVDVLGLELHRRTIHTGRFAPHEYLHYGCIDIDRLRLLK